LKNFELEDKNLIWRANCDLIGLVGLKSRYLEICKKFIDVKSHQDDMFGDGMDWFRSPKLSQGDCERTR
jgi:hypothetical protein